MKNGLLSLLAITLLASGCGGGGGGSSVAPPSITSFTGSASSIEEGASLSLTAVFTGGTGSINNGVGSVVSGAAVSVTPTATTTYILTVRNSAGTSVTRSVSVNVTPVDSGSGWVSGLFLDYPNYADLCQSPRTGTDPETGQPFPDIQGTTLDENNYLRSFSNDTYLWYQEIADRDPGLYSDPLGYFDLLKTNAITASGQYKDKFHFTYDSYDWYQLSQSGVSGGYGAQWVLLSTTPPREIVVAYTEPSSPAEAVGLTRGATILTVDGVDINTNTQAGVNALNDGLFPESLGETHIFTIRDQGSSTTRSITMTSASITSDPVQNVRVLDTLSGRVGYIQFNDHILTAEGELVDAITELASGGGVDDLVLDVRYNGGGYLFIASQLAYMIAGRAQTVGRTFELMQFNDKYPGINPITGQTLSPTPFYSTTSGYDRYPANQSLPSLNLSRVYVITGSGTCSASEAIINGLRGVDVEVIQIGSTTCGKPYGFYAQGNCGTTYFTIQFRGVNEKGFGDYTDGFSASNQVLAGTPVPGCSVADDFTAALGDPLESRLATALNYRATQACPAPSGVTHPGVSKPGAPLSSVDGVLLKSPWLMNRIMRR